MPGDVFDNQFPTQAEKDMYHAVKKKKLEEGETEEEAKTSAARITHAYFNKRNK